LSNDKSFDNIWDALTDSPGEAANMQAKAELMRQIVVRIKATKLTQAEAARLCGITQPRMNDMLRGRISRFSLDALVNIAAAIGCRIHIELDAA
jgi:predicted XRE-type DNA-binding protein